MPENPISWICKTVLLLLFLGLSVPLQAEPVPLTIWQKEKRFQPQQGDEITLQRGPFRLVFPLQKGESVGIAGAPEEDRPQDVQAFEPGRGMAGPYDGFFLDWEAHHYLYYDYEDPQDRADLWDRRDGLCSWKVTRLYERCGDELCELDFERAPDLILILRKDGYQDLEFRVHWD